MLRNYLTIAARSLLRRKGQTAISMIGLVVGVACGLLILQYVRFEFSYDRFHDKAEHIYRVTFEESSEGTTAHRAVGPPALGPALEREFGEVVRTVRVAQRGPGAHLLRARQDVPYEEVTVAYADADFFELFNFTFLAGSPQNALSAPYRIVLTASAATRYFGTINVVGRTLDLQLGANSAELTVGGVIEDVPPNSHFSFEMLGSLSTIQREFPGPTSDDTWRFYWAHTYLLLAEGFDPARLQAKLPEFADRHMAESTRLRGSTFRFYLQPLLDIHLRSHLEAEFQDNGSLQHLYAFIAVGLFVLLIAAINFVNLSTARAAEREREVGVRKVIGAQRQHLIRQFMVESLLAVGIAVLAGYLLALTMLPLFNALIGAVVTVQDMLRPSTLGITFCLVIGLGALAGFYPALYLSSLRPIRMLNQASPSGRTREATTRRALVLTQFALATALLIGTMVVTKQVGYMRSAELGFDQERIVLLPYHASMQEAVAPETVKETILRHPAVERAAAVKQAPAGENLFTNAAVIPEGFEHNIPIMWHTVDADFVPTLGLDLASGQNFHARMTSDDGVFLINEAAARRFGWDEPVGKRLLSPVSGNPMGTVIGVIGDFHVHSLHHAIQPIVFRLPPNPGQLRSFAVRLAPGDPGPALGFLEAQWRRFAPDRAFEYTFLDEQFSALYRNDARMNRLVGVLTGLAILIACIGLLGLGAFAVQRRTKEIGIRRVLGASAASIVSLLTREVVWLVAAAFLVAVPVSFLVVRRWLDGFAYRIDLDPGIFIMAGGLVLVIALMTVSYQSVQAALSDPVQSLRRE